MLIIALRSGVDSCPRTMIEAHIRSWIASVQHSHTMQSSLQDLESFQIARGKRAWSWLVNPDHLICSKRWMSLARDRDRPRGCRGDLIYRPCNCACKGSTLPLRLESSINISWYAGVWPLASIPPMVYWLIQLPEKGMKQVSWASGSFGPCSST